MEIRLDTAKNARVTCSVDGRFLHSKYDPEKEAKNFVNSLECEYSPSCVILLGACLPYCVPYLKIRFPNIAIYAVYYSSFFYKNDTIQTSFIENHYHCTKAFLCSESTSKETVQDDVFLSLGEIELYAPLVIEWKASQVSFPNVSPIAWDVVKGLLQMSNSIIATRSYFSSRWLKNIIGFCRYVKTVSILKKIDIPILLLASGSSLNKFLSHIKKCSGSFFIIALSSALESLIENDIVPDLCIATDGGYYAKNHLDIMQRLHKKNITIPLAVCAESNVPKEILSTIPIIPLTYNDGLESQFLQLCNIPAISAQRNGTVSGTAAMLALSMTEKSVYAVGLDLLVGNGYSHAQPNAHEKIHAAVDYRLKPLSQRLYKNVVGNVCERLSPMQMYRQWFITRDENFAKRFFRVVPGNTLYSDILGSIKNIRWTDVTLCAEKHVQEKTNYFKVQKILNCEKRKSLLKEYVRIQKDKPTKEWLEHCALVENLAVYKYPQSNSAKNKLEKKLQSCYNEVKDLIT